MDAIEILAWIFGIILFFIITTFILKKLTKAQTFYIASLFRTTRFLPLFDKYSKHKTLLNIFADIGLVIGFGAIGIDYLIREKFTKPVRVIIFIVSAIVLFFLFNFFFSSLLSSPFVSEYDFFISLGFGIMGFSGFILMILFAYADFIISTALAGEKTCPNVAPLIPGVSLPNFPVTVPLHGWISLFIILVVHEGMHGVLARKAKLAIKSAGLILLGILPIGAFVEPDEKKLKKLDEKEQVRLYSAGPTANIALCIVVFFIVLVGSLGFSLAFGSWSQQEYSSVVKGVGIVSVDQNINFCGKVYSSPAYGKLVPGMTIKDVNGNTVSSVNDVEKFVSLSGKNPYSLTVDLNGTISTVSITPNELGRHGYGIGSELKDGMDFSPQFKTFSVITNFFSSFFTWLILLSFLVAIMNFLPMTPFDGGKIAQIIFLPYFGFIKKPKEEKQKLIGKIMFYVVLALLALNALPWVL